MDDLESALLQAGAVTIVDDIEYQGEKRIERVPLTPELETADPGLEPRLAAVSIPREEEEDIPDFVTSAPGKVILFGEHAVVYGKVSLPPSAWACNTAFV